MLPDLETEMTKLEKEFNGKGEEDYTRELQHATFDQLENKLKELSKHAQAIISTQNNDPELIKAKKVVSNLNKPYNEQKKWNGKRARLVFLTMMENFPERMEDYGSTDE